MSASLEIVPAAAAGLKINPMRFIFRHSARVRCIHLTTTTPPPLTPVPSHQVPLPTVPGDMQVTAADGSRGGPVTCQTTTGHCLQAPASPGPCVCLCKDWTGWQPSSQRRLGFPAGSCCWSLGPECACPRLVLPEKWASRLCCMRGPAAGLGMELAVEQGIFLLKSS